MNDLFDQILKLINLHNVCMFSIFLKFSKPIMSVEANEICVVNVCIHGRGTRRDNRTVSVLGFQELPVKRGESVAASKGIAVVVAYASYRIFAPPRDLVKLDRGIAACVFGWFPGIDRIMSSGSHLIEQRQQQDVVDIDVSRSALTIPSAEITDKERTQCLLAGDILSGKILHFRDGPHFRRELDERLCVSIHNLEIAAGGKERVGAHHVLA